MVNQNLKLDKISKAYNILESFYLNSADDIETSVYDIMGTYKHPKSELAFELLEKLKELSLEVMSIAQTEANQISKTLNN